MTLAADPQFAAAPSRPRHVAIIMDGNGRWAQQRGLPRTMGHREGAKAVRRTVEAAVEEGIEYLTLFGFSSENWKRPVAEVTELMNLLRRYIKSELAELLAEGVRLRVIGDRRALDKDIVELIEDAERRSADNSRLTLVVALSYGGRQEIVRAARALAGEAAAGRLDPASIDEAALQSALYTKDLPDPDLLIRTSGEKRISNFLLWQCAYAEMVFSETYWPDFGGEDLRAAIENFGLRERRYGATLASS